MNKEKELKHLLLVSLLICIINFITKDVPEINFGIIHGNDLMEFVVQISMGYISSYIFYTLIKIVVNDKERKEKETLLEYIYPTLVKRLCECITDIEIRFGFIDFVESSGLKYHSSIFGAYLLNKDSLKAMKLLHSIMKDMNFRKYNECLKLKNNVELDKDLNVMATETFEDTRFKSRLYELKYYLLQQLFLLEEDNVIKENLHMLMNNISDIDEHILGQKEMSTGEIYKHLVRFVEHIITIYEYLLVKNLAVNTTYHT